MNREFECSAFENVVETTYGRVRGYTFRGIHTFHGIRYAEAVRYHMPTPPRPWSGVRNAFDYGYTAPQMRKFQPVNTLFDAGYPWPEDEDCHFLNVWSPSLSGASRKPVMVWIHGGGYVSGSANMAREMDGTSLSLFGDVVVVSMNHRLSVLGCLDLSRYGGQYENSGNLVMADIVAALQWVRENIASFGGDPDNVTVFGHSSGGAKISNLLQISAADGLYHKAIIQTGIIPPTLRPDPEDSYALSEMLLKELGIAPQDVQRIETVPLDQLMSASAHAMEGLHAQGRNAVWGVHPNSYFAGDPLVVGLRAHAREIPIMTGTTIGEFWSLNSYPGRDELPDDLLEERLHEKFGDQTERLKRLFYEAYPWKHPSVLLSLDSHARLCALDFLDHALEMGCKKLYSYLFAWDFPYFGGMPAWHGAEIPFVFHNAQCVPLYSKPGVTQRLEAQISSAWVHFACTADPSCPELGAWPAYGATQKATMVFDEVCRLKTDYDRDLVELVQRTAPWF